MSKLEQEVMKILWEYEGCTVREVMNQLQKKKKLAYTTVGTILQRLFTKGLVKRKGIQLSYYYSPKISKVSYSQHLAKSFLQKFIGTFGDTAIASFAQSIDKLPENKRAYFLKLLAKDDTTK